MRNTSDDKFDISDHDLLLKCYFEIKAMKTDIQAYRIESQGDIGESSKQLKDIEKRIGKLETWRAVIMAVLAAYMFLLQVLPKIIESFRIVTK